MYKVRKEATIWIVVIFLLSMGIANAEPKSNIISEKINGAVVVVTDFVGSEIDKTKEYQKKSWASAKLQLSDLLKKIGLVE